ncbi:GCN5-like N-acetyltransferase [Zopfochytrium polystomum]|nr:GCN5-like N-acetyltransferase [Zopfochytrium polystomum]
MSQPSPLPPPPPFRLATAADAEAVVALVNGAYRGDSGRAGWTTESDYLDGPRLDVATVHDDLLDDPRNNTKCLLVLPEEPPSVADGPGGGATTPLVACIFLEHIPASTPSTVYVGLVTVRPAAQRAGVGARLLAAAEEYAVGRFGAARAVMRVIEQREELVRYYERRGYRKTGERKPFLEEKQKSFVVPKRNDLMLIRMAKDL